MKEYSFLLPFLLYCLIPAFLKGRAPHLIQSRSFFLPDNNNNRCLLISVSSNTEQQESTCFSVVTGRQVLLSLKDLKNLIAQSILGLREKNKEEENAPLLKLFKVFGRCCQRSKTRITKYSHFLPPFQCGFSIRMTRVTGFLFGFMSLK